LCCLVDLGAVGFCFGGDYKRVNATWSAYKETLEKNQANFTAHFYQGAKHGFHNDCTAGYSQADAELAWYRTIEFFTKQLV
jgi:carboxymethylenebutenolidase